MEDKMFMEVMYPLLLVSALVINVLHTCIPATDNSFETGYNSYKQDSVLGIISDADYLVL